MKLRHQHLFVMKQLSLVVALACASQFAPAQTVTKTLQIDTPNTVDPANVAPGDVITYTATYTNNTGSPITNIDLADVLTTPAGSSLVAGSINISGAREVRIYRDNISIGDEFDDAGTSGNDGTNNFLSNWDEIDGNGGGGETNGATGGDEQILANGGREVIRIQDDNGAGNNRGEGVGRSMDLSSCVANTLSFDIAGSGLDNSTDSIYLEESTATLTGTTWTELIDFDVNFTGSTGNQRDIVNNTYQTNVVDLSLTGSASHHIRFITSDDNGNNDGAFIDNVQVTAVCGVLADFSAPSLATLMDSGDLDGSNEYTNGESVYGLLDGESITITYDVLVDDGASTGAIDNDFDADFYDAYTGAGPTNVGDTTTTTVAYFDDAGDAPDISAGSGSGDYTTLLANGGPRHRVVAGVQLGNTAPDIDSGGFVEGTDTNGDASDDDAAGDEGVAQLLDDSAHPSGIFPSFTAGDSSYQLTVDYDSTGAGTLYGWIDLDADGLFEQSERATAAVNVAGTEVALNWSSLGASSAATTYARFRISTDNLDSLADADGIDDDAALGFASDGEVEDYQFTILPPPVCYAAYSDASINDTVFDLLPLTPVATGNQADFNVLTNNNDADDDNYGMVFTTTLVVPSTGNYDFRLNSDDGSQLYIDGKLILDYDGLHGFASPQTVTNVPLTAGNSELQIFFFENDGGNDLSIEWTASGGGFATLGGSDIAPPASCPVDPQFPLDYGDADAAYADAYHTIAFDDDYFLGSIAPDTEAASPSVGADSDDLSGIDDEDANPVLTGLDNTFTGNYVVSLPVSNSGADATLGGWIDFDGDNIFETNEFASATVTSSDTSVDLTFNTNAADSVNAGTTYARFRMSRDTINSSNATGLINGGEVEDYSLSIADASQVYFEAECGIAGNIWTAQYDASVSQSTYIETTVNRTNTLGTATEPNANMVRYDIQVPIAGTYDLYSLVNFNGGANNSFHVSTDNLNWTTWNALDTGVVWQWGDTGLNVTTTTTNESVTIYLSYREDGSLIDKFGLTAAGAPTGFGNNVGSCFDFGDAADISAGNGAGDYTTELARLGPYHAVDGAATIYIGSNTPDTEADALDNADATGDDISDEGTAQLLSTAQGDSFPTLLPTDTSYSFEIDITNSVDSAAATNAELFAWIDFDKDGLFEESELADLAPFTIAYNASSQTQTVSWSGLSGLTVGTTTARFRISTDTQLTAGNNGGEDEASLGVVIDGEVEDHQILIGGDDYGDAPDSYGDAFHEIPAIPTLYLGAVAPDPEADTQLGGDAGVGADGDDTNGTDDEASPSSIPAINTNQVGQIYSIDVSVVNSSSNADADLFGWIDFDGSGTFEPGEGTTVNAPSNGVYQLQWTIPALTVGDSYLRLRLTSDPLVTASTPTGSASDGEVEDYPISITQPFDFGDAIDTALGTGLLNYRTELVDDGPRHLLSSNLYLGDTAADADNDAFDNGAATGDNLNATADEGVAQLLTTAQGATLPTYLVGNASYSFDIDLNNSTAGNASLYAWIDYDRNGSFDEDEFLASGPLTISNTQSSATLSFNTTSDAAVGSTYMRIRLTSDALTASAGGEDERSFGSANDGEVEDYRISLVGLDFGDAPDSYATDRTDDGGEGVGPSHRKIGTLYIGATAPDIESNGLPTPLASGDDTDATDDEGGFFVPSISTFDTDYDLNVTLVNNTGLVATLYGWLDFEADGDFTGAGEGVSVTVPTGATSATLNWPSFTAIPASQTFVRLRLTTDAAITTSTPGGAAINGEVEDRIVIVGDLDFGDAPDSYSTDTTAGNGGGFDLVGPSHAVTADLFIGDIPDGEANGQPSVDATADGTDEDNSFVTAPGLLTPANQSYSLEINLTNSTGANAELLGWIDFDSNGFYDSDEATTVTVSHLDTSATLTWTSVPADITPDITFLRLRLTSDPRVATGVASTSSPTGVAANGEVEDHQITITTAYDYGDAPDTYGTDLTNSGGEGFGPRHVVSPILFIGPVAADAENDGQPSADALLDDNTGVGEDSPLDSTDGDEGDLFLTTIQPDVTSYTVNVPLTNATTSNATLYGWLDINQNGVFDGGVEEESVIIPPGSSFGVLTFSWSSGDTSGGNGLDNGNTFLRLRLSTDTGLGATQASAIDTASDGEISDYPILVSETTCDLLYGIYDDGGFTGFREFDNDTVNLTTTPFQTAGVGLDRTYRRVYYIEWVDTGGGGDNQLNYYDAATGTHIDTGAGLTPGGNNFNRMAFSYEGRGAIVESASFDIHLFDPTVSGTGQSITAAIPTINEASILGGGGDIAFDRDDNLYLLSYTTGGGANFYLYELRFFPAGGSGNPDNEIAIGDLNLATPAAYEATATFLLSEANPTGGANRRHGL